MCIPSLLNNKLYFADGNQGRILVTIFSKTAHPPHRMYPGFEDENFKD